MDVEKPGCGTYFSGKHLPDHAGKNDLTGGNKAGLTAHE